ncbi:unnamed protein product [Trichobilharzia szidati]|nr:unnamed protein product [Trichobilharzia szidati]
MDLKEVTSFTYLASIVSTTGGTDEDVRLRIGKARNTFINLKPIWKSSSLSLHQQQNSDFQYKRQVSQFFFTDQKLGQCVTKNISNSLLQTFINNCLLSILKIRWPERITNKKLWEKTKQEPIAKQICRRKWRWIRHSLRRPLGDIARQASARVEPEREAASGTSKGDMEEIVCRGAETVSTYMDAGEKYSRRQKEVGDLQLKPYVPLGTQGSINNNNNH